jgi:hypothetical protein
VVGNEWSEKNLKSTKPQLAMIGLSDQHQDLRFMNGKTSRSTVWWMKRFLLSKVLAMVLGA